MLKLLAVLAYAVHFGQVRVLSWKLIKPIIHHSPDIFTTILGEVWVSFVIAEIKLSDIIIVTIFIELAWNVYLITALFAQQELIIVIKIHHTTVRPTRRR